MADKNILHMVTPLKHMSPFDVNMALDAGYDAVVTYTGVTLDEVTGLVQDAIFSRPPKIGARLPAGAAVIIKELAQPLSVAFLVVAFFWHRPFS